MKSILSVLALTFLFSFSTQANELNCTSDVSVSIKEVVSLIKMKGKVPADLLQVMGQRITEAKTCEEVDRINLSIIGFVISSM